MSTAGSSASALASTTRTQQLLRAIVGGFAGRVVNLLAPFIVMPAMLRYLGDGHFGVWMTAVSLTSMALFADLGIGNGLLTRLSAAFGRNDREAARLDISSAYATLTTVAVVLTVLGCLLWLAASQGLGGKDWKVDREGMAIAAASISAFILGIPANVIQRVMYASQQVVQANLWQIGGAALSVTLALGAIWLAADPPLVVLGYALASPFILIVSAILYFLRHGDIAPQLQDVRWPAARELIHLGSRFLLLSVLTSVAMNVDNIIIAARAGHEAVTAYAVPAKIGSLLGLVITAVYLPMWSANGEALARGDIHWVRTQACRMSLIGGGGIAIAGFALTISGDFLIQFWIGRQFKDQSAILAMLSVLSTVTAFASPYNMILNSMGVLRVQIICWSIFLFITVISKYYIVNVDRIWVVPLVSAIAYAAIILPIIFCAARAKLAENHP